MATVAHGHRGQHDEQLRSSINTIMFLLGITLPFLLGFATYQRPSYGINRRRIRFPVHLPGGHSSVRQVAICG
jgi:hypothetical protein